MRRSNATRWLVALMAGGAVTGSSQTPAIRSLDAAGRIVFAESSNATGYRVESAPSPTGAWTSEGPALIPSGSGTVSVALSFPGSAAAFYRVAATPAAGGTGTAIEVTDMTEAGIRAAIAQAGPGDVVSLPAGAFPLTNTIFLREGIRLRGRGRDLTTLVKIGSNNNPIFRLNATSGVPFKISDIAFQGLGVEALRQNTNSTLLDVGISLIGRVSDFVVQGCRFSGFAGSGIYIFGSSGAPLTGHARGVIRNCEFRDLYYVVNNDARGYGVAVYGDDSWPVQTDPGTDSAVFVEDNYFEHNRHSIAGNHGARYVFRYNDIRDNYAHYGAVDAHGKQSWSSTGTRSYEIYGNSIYRGVLWPTNAPSPGWALMLRGGDGVVWSNRYLDTYAQPFALVVEDLSTNPAYPVACQTTNLWIWGNTRNGVTNDGVRLGWSAQIESNNAPYLRIDRDYHIAALPHYVPFPYPHPRGRLEGHWTMDETNGAVAVDKSASGRNATTIGTASLAPGMCDRARTFNGSGDCMEVGTYAAELNPTSFTLSAWARVDGGAGTLRTLVSSMGLGGYAVLVNAQERWTLRTGRGDGTYDDLTGPAASQGAWTHVAAVCDTASGTRTLYVNGETAATNSGVPIAINSDAPFRIGAVSALYNRIPDGSFETGFGAVWAVESGSPVPDMIVKKDLAQSIGFLKPLPLTAAPLIRCEEYVPIEPGRGYVISAWAKGDAIVRGPEDGHRLVMAGRWYDASRVEIGGTCDLAMPTGTFDWTYCYTTVTAPAGAAYYRVCQLGLHGAGTGTAWVDAAAIRPSTQTTTLDYFNGALDDVRSYSTALSEAWIRTLYNRMPDGSFETGTNGSAWGVYTGVPVFDNATKKDGAQSFYCSKSATNSPLNLLRGARYVPVAPQKDYVLSAWAKGENLQQGSQSWHRLMMAGRWYDKNMTELGATCDLAMPTGTYDWTHVSTVVAAPTNAAYYRVYWMGISGAGTGAGWIDLAGIRPAVE